MNDGQALTFFFVQVLLRWNLQHGSCVIPKSTNPSRIDENKGIWDWSLSKEDYDKLSSIKFQVQYSLEKRNTLQEKLYFKLSEQSLEEPKWRFHTNGFFVRGILL